MVKKLTKESVLEGANRRENLYVREYDAEVVIRPLTDGELSKVFAILGNIPIKEDGTPDTSKIEVSKNLDALRLATSLGLVEPNLTFEEVSTMKFGAPEYIGMKILELSGVAGPEQAKKKG